MSTREPVDIQSHHRCAKYRQIYQPTQLKLIDMHHNGSARRKAKETVSCDSTKGVVDLFQNTRWPPKSSSKELEKKQETNLSSSVQLVRLLYIDCGYLHGAKEEDDLTMIKSKSK
jgi:hypothetical protein